MRHQPLTSASAQRATPQKARTLAVAVALFGVGYGHPRSRSEGLRVVFRSARSSARSFANLDNEINEIYSTFWLVKRPFWWV